MVAERVEVEEVGHVNVLQAELVRLRCEVDWVAHRVVVDLFQMGYSNELERAIGY